MLDFRDTARRIYYVPRYSLFCLLLVGSAVCTGQPKPADAALENEVRLLFATGVWDRAVALLEKTPTAKTDPAQRELLAMAFLYSASRVDSFANLDKAKALMKEIVNQGGA